MTKDKEYYGFIYITTNNVNGKKYIGQKSYNQKNWKTYLGSGIVLNRAIKRHGKENFSREIIEECKTKEDLDQREKYWISYYDAVNSEDFYNIALGGDGGNTIAGYSEEQLEEYKKWKSELHKQTAPKGENAPRSKLTEKEVKEIIQRLLLDEFSSDICKDYNVSVRTIDDIREYRTWRELTKDIEFSDISHRGRHPEKPVAQYSYPDRIYINTYKSAREVEEKTGIGFRMVSRVCNGERPHTHGYIFEFV